MKTAILYLTTVIVLSTSALADSFCDLGISDLVIVPEGGGTYSVTVSVDIAPGESPPIDDVFVSLSQGPEVIAEMPVPTFGLPSGECCANSSTCKPVSGYTITCGASCDSPPPSFVCIYRKSASFVGLALTPGATLTAAVDPDSAHLEVCVPSAANSISGTVPTLVGLPLLGPRGLALLVAALAATGAFAFRRLRGQNGTS